MDEYEGERTLDDLAGEAEKDAVKHKAARDKYSRQASVLIDKRNQLQEKARKLSSEAKYMRDRRDDYNHSAIEARGKRDEWNDRAASMKARGGLGDIGEARSQSNNYHQKAVKFSNSGQLAHEKMKQLTEEADALRQQAQTYHEQAMELRRAADAEHELYIKAKRRAQAIRESPDYRSAGALAADDALDDAERDVACDGYLDVVQALAVLLQDLLADRILDLHRALLPVVDRDVQEPFGGRAFGATPGFRHGSGRPGVVASEAVVDPRRDIPLMGTALRAPLGRPVVGIPSIIAPLAGDRQMRHVPFDRSAPGAPFGFLVSSGNPHVRTTSAPKHTCRLIRQLPYPPVPIMLYHIYRFLV